MPSVSQTFNRQLGPIIDIAVGVTEARQIALMAAEIVIPQFQLAHMLIDTGASHTCLDPSVIAPLGLTPTGTVSIHTPSTQGAAHQVAQYDVRILVHGPPSSARWFDALPVSECNLKAQGIDGLLGRDVLGGCTLIYLGEMNVWSLCF